MAEIRTYPYLTPDPKHIVVTRDWQYFDALGEAELKNLLLDWEPTTVLDGEITVRLDLPGILRACGLGSDAKLRLVAGWRSSGTMLRGSGTRVDLSTNNSKRPITVRVSVSAAEVSHDLVLFAALILVTPGSQAHRLSPKVPGSVLWLTENRILVDNESLYFPTEITDFRSRTWDVPSEAGWYLQWDPEDLYQSVFSDVQLYLNASHPAVSSTLVAKESPSDMLQQILFFDLARTLIIGALANPEFVNDPTQYPEGSAGAAVHNIICEYFPNETAASLYAKSKSPSLFEATLQHHLAFLKA